MGFGPHHIKPLTACGPIDQGLFICEAPASLQPHLCSVPSSIPASTKKGMEDRLP